MADKDNATAKRLRLKQRIRELPVAPTLLTGGNLACGMTAILLAVDNQLWPAVLLIFVAMFLDLFDGKVARMTGTDGPFGAELDSLADVVSFGVAPAFLMHRLFLGEPGVWGQGEKMVLIIAVIYAVLTAIRLARYNVEAAVKEDHEGPAPYFKGLPSPGAAAVVCSWVALFAHLTDYAPLAETGTHWVAAEPQWSGSWLSQVMTFEVFSVSYRFAVLGGGLLLAFLMVSNIPFPHLGNTLLNRNIQFRQIILGVFIIGLIAFFHIYALVLLPTAYVITYMVPGLFKVVRRWRQGKDLFDEAEDPEDGDTAEDPARAAGD